MLFTIFVLALPFSSASISSFVREKVENAIPLHNCYKELGCFPNDYPWTSVLRPVPPPERPEKVNTEIYMYTRKDKTDRYTPRLWPTIEMQGSDFDASREQTIFIIHGFIETGNKTWLQDMRFQLLGKYDANVFQVDWGHGAVSLSYFQAVSNTRIVGAEVARFIKYLVDRYNLSLDKINIIGHSLGAQVASYAGKEFKGQIGQITALDPAQPGFEGTPDKVHLHSSDAMFVQAIHTDARPFVPFLGFGMMAPVGSNDYYVNGGHHQPDCTVPDRTNAVTFKQLATLPIEVLGKLVSCSHQSSVRFYIASINADCKLWGYKTSNNFEAILNTRTVQQLKAIVKGCTADTCSVLGPDAIKYKARGIFVVLTTSKAPYCDTTYDPTYDQQMQDAIDRS
ncbi:pancreatic lipase-related protein 2-like [Lycorma delicatula]|uniref:pancreatic lipase-related protein 2-like n=1 Tax=Lycorma delicatula TaxID=130591 RepID=UPI003F519C07